MKLVSCRTEVTTGASIFWDGKTRLKKRHSGTKHTSGAKTRILGAQEKGRGRKPEIWQRICSVPQVPAGIEDAA